MPAIHFRAGGSDLRNCRLLACPDRSGKMGVVDDDLTSRDQPPGPPVEFRALVVENNLVSRELLARVLRGHGCEAQTALGAAQASAILGDEQSGRFDFLVVDLDLAGSDGAEVVRQAAALPAARRPVKVIALGLKLADHYPHLERLGIDVELFQKPLHVASLFKLIDGITRPAARP